MSQLLEGSRADQRPAGGVALITGASRGIGAATARLAAQRGYSICVNYRHDHDAARQVVAGIEAGGGRAIAIAADVASEAEVVRLFETCDRQLGRLTALVNNAGILETQIRVENIDAARLYRVFATNVFGAFLCAREAVRRMGTAAGGAGGTIVNVSSVAARLGAPGEYVDYAASKGALDTMTVGLAQEVAADGIRVNAVRAGYIYTDMHASGGEPQRVDRVKAHVPMKRGGQADEVAQAILWLLCAESSFTTGSFIDVAGGRYDEFLDTLSRTWRGRRVPRITGGVWRFVRRAADVPGQATGGRLHRAVARQRALHRSRGVRRSQDHRRPRKLHPAGVYVIFVQADYGDDAAVALYTKLGIREDVMHFDIQPAPAA